MIEDHVGMSCVWIACCMIEKISKDCKIELCGLLAHSTVGRRKPKCAEFKLIDTIVIKGPAVLTGSVHLVTI